MKKRELFSRLDKLFKDKTPEEINETLINMKYGWIDEYGNERFKDLVYCPECEKYSNYKDVKYGEEEVERVDSAHDDDFLAKDLIRYRICPKCGKKTEETILDREIIKWL